MARRSVQWYLHKVLRISGYVFFFVIVLMVMSGLAMTGHYGFDRLFSPDTAWTIHSTLKWPIIGLFLIHGIVAWYLSFRRWGWVK
jgi:hypothetical protein